jgi:hypothetical protein
VKLVINITASMLIGIGITACSGGGSDSTRVNSAAMNSVIGFQRAAGKKSGPTLYVLNSNGASGSSSITVYSGGGAKLLRTISVGKKGSPSFTVDGDGKLYASDYPGHGRATLRIYENQGAKLVGKWRQKQAYVDLTADASGNIFTTCGITVCEYDASGKVTRKFTHATFPLAVDNSGDVSVSECGGKGDNGVQCIFAPGETKPFWTADAAAYPADSGFDPSGDLYVAISGGTGGVQEFAPNGSDPTRTLTAGMTNPYALAFDTANNVYVLNQGAVTVYPPTGTEPTRTISQGIGGCGLHSACIHPIAFDDSGDLYVANNAANTITVYAPNTSTPVRTITTGIDGPIGLSVGP